MQQLKIDKSKVDRSFGVYLCFGTSEIREWADDEPNAISLFYSAEELNAAGFPGISLEVGEIATSATHANINNAAYI